MKVLTKCVEIENEKFVLVSDEKDGKRYYGTIPYSELDESGRMKRVLNGVDICIDWESIPAALEERRKNILLKKYMEEGHTLEETARYNLTL